MALYSVYVRPDLRGAESSNHDKTRLVEVGFSWFAFLLPIIYLLFHRIWRWFLVVLALEIGLSSLIERLALPNWTLFLALLTVMLYVGVAGRDWLGAALERRGFRLAGVFAGASEDEAFAAYIRHPKPKARINAPVKPLNSPETGPVLGLFPEPETRI